MGSSVNQNALLEYRISTHTQHDTAQQIPAGTSLASLQASPTASYVLTDECNHDRRL